MAAADDFLQAAGQSLGEAQAALVGSGADVPTRMAISEAQLEVKAALDTTEGGLAIEPIGVEALRSGNIDAALVSTVTLHFVPFADGDAKPRRRRDEVVGGLRDREDLKRLAGILGPLTFEAEFLPPSRRWIVTARDPERRTVREIVVSDDA